MMDDIERDMAVLEEGQDLLDNAYRLLNSAQQKLMVSLIALTAMVVLMLFKQWWLVALTLGVWGVFVVLWWVDLHQLHEVLRRHRMLMQHFSLRVHHG